MTALLVIVLFLAFVGADILVRMTARKLAERQALQAREAALETSVRLDFSHEAPRSSDAFAASVPVWSAPSLRSVFVPGVVKRTQALSSIDPSPAESKLPAIEVHPVGSSAPASDSIE